jgi:branched-subunit amino acid ABC-type transport system permease component
MRAIADDRVSSRLAGIHVGRMIGLAFGLSAGLGAVAGIVIGPLRPTYYFDGLMMTVKGFFAAMIGGLGNFPGAIVGGIAIGLFEAFSAGFVSSLYKDGIVLLIFIIILIIKPSGLFHRRLGSYER